MSSRRVKIGDRFVGEDEKVMVVAELGINHNGDIGIAKELIAAAALAGADAVKFQKRTISVVYTPEELAKPRESPFGSTNGDLKRRLEFDHAAYQEIDNKCREMGLLWFASCWDEESVDFIESFNPPCYKIASASLTDDGLLRHTKAKGRPIMLSTGMSTEEEVDRAVEILGEEDLIILHTVSTYPAEDEELNLRTMRTLRERYPKALIGYSGHEKDVIPSVMATAMGACVLERHFTLDKAMFGSDQKASIEPQELAELVRCARQWETVRGDGIKRLHVREIPVKEKLRRK